MLARVQSMLIATVPLLFAVLLQVQVTLFSTESYIGLRVNSADFLLPFLGLFITFSLFTKRSQWPNWLSGMGYWVFIPASCAILFAVFNTYMTLGSITSWALVNKFCGWFILLAFAAAGAWLRTNTTEGNAAGRFMMVFVTFVTVTLIYEAIHRYLFFELGASVYRPMEYIEGFMFNRNAFAFLLISSIFFAGEYAFRNASLPKMQMLILSAFWLLMPFAFIFNASRALWIAIALLAVFMVARYRVRFLKHALPLLLLGTILLPFIFQNASNVAMRPILYTLALFVDVDKVFNTQLTGTAISAEYDTHRFTVTRNALNLSLENKYTGAGLGAIITDQKEQYGEVLSVLDNTLLWILTEMGPFGLFSFVLLYIVMLHTLFKSRKQSPLHAATLFILVGFGFFSLFHEILYSRFMWFILGMALVEPIQRQMQRSREDHPEHQKTALG